MELLANSNTKRRCFIGGSDARAIMGHDEGALIRLWREKRGEIEPEDLSGNLTVQFGIVTEDLNRRWFERETGRQLAHVQTFLRHPKLEWMGANSRRRGQRRACRLRSQIHAPLVLHGRSCGGETHAAAAAQHARN